MKFCCFHSRIAAAESSTSVFCRVASFANGITFVVVQVSLVEGAIQIVQALLICR